MFVCHYSVVITQVSTDQYPGRTKMFSFDFVNSNSGESTWEHLTDTFKLILPRRLWFKDASTGKSITWDNTPVYGNPATQPLLLRGDKIMVSQGYSYFKPTAQGFDRNTSVRQQPTVFEGFITKIYNKTPITLECKDNMFCLQQSAAPNKKYTLDGKAYTVETMLKEMLSKSTFPGVKDFTIRVDNFATKFGAIYTYSNFTIAQVLDDLRKTGHLVAFFRGEELRVGVIRYYPEDRVTHQFHFQKNIISDDLDYQRADDIRIGIIAKSINKVELSNTNSSGTQKKTTHKQLEVQVGDADGELRTLFFSNVPDTATLRKLAEKKMQFLKYEGFRGTFTTFALPSVKHGDVVVLTDDVVKERSGSYLVKKVSPHVDQNGGIRQRIELDIRIDGIIRNGVADTKTLNEYQANGL